MKRNALLLLVLTTGSVLFGCSNDKNSDDPKPKAKSELLMAKSWNFVGETETKGSTTKSINNPCDLDDVLTFSAGNILTADNGAIQCDPTADRIITGKWDLSENDTKLTFTVFSFPIKYTIEELTESKLIISTIETSGSGTIVVRTTFTGK